MFGFEAIIDIPALLAILGLTPVIRQLFRVPDRFVLLIPIFLGVIAGLSKALIAQSLVGPWYSIIGGILWTALLYSGAASIIYKSKRTLIQGK